MRNTRHLALLFSLLSLLPTFTSAAPIEPTDSPVLKIGAILTLSGGFAAAGEDCRRGLEAALSEDQNSEKLKFVYADSRNEASQAISEFRRLTEIEKVSAIYLNRAAMAMPINPLSKSARVPLLGAVGHSAFVPDNQYAFQIWPNSSDEGSFLAQQLLAQGRKRIALVFSQDEWTQSSAAGFREAFKKLGGTLVLDESVLTTDTNFQSLLLKVKATSPDGIYATLTLAQLAPFFKHAYNLHVPGARFSNFYVAKKEVLEAAGNEAVEGLSFYDIQTALPKLHDRLKLAPQEAIPALAVVSYVAAKLLLQALETQKTSNLDLYASLLKQTEIRTADYAFKLEDRYVKFPLILKTIRNGQVQ